MEVNRFEEFGTKVMDNVGNVIVGKKDRIEKIMVAFICGGHVLLEDVPGLGKTKMARALAKTLECNFKRVQFTPDLMPSDLTGIYYFNQKNQEFEFRKGPVLTEFLLADEINRATPRTQSALLEAMEERQLTVEGNTIKLARPFFVMATENPVEQYGTFPLPEAQMDRFFMKLSMGYPDYQEEKQIMDRFIEKDPLDEIKPIVSKAEIEYLQSNYVYVTISDHIKGYILDIINKTRDHIDIEMGASPRGTLNLMKGCQALAALRGRDYVIPEDVKELAPWILGHRIILKSSYDKNQGSKIIENILNEVKTPLEEL